MMTSGDKSDEEVLSPLDAALQAPEATDEYVRPPPEYPEGLHEAAKADRLGPFWSSLGEPDVSTGVRPNYLRRDDWHISSTYTAEKRTAVEAEEQEWIEAVRLSRPGDAIIDVTDDEDYDPFEEKEYMKLEPGPPATGALASAVAMPGSWQEYQFLQNQLATLVAAGGPVATEAAVHETNLADFYLTFKDILAQGWKLSNNVQVEAAVKFLLKETKTAAPKSEKTADEKATYVE